uniref:Uncharacterized protein n=1 Tax=Palpitomonas bilix TaxID=652834 RepID=A0A7S3CZ00_9EUKA
MAEGLIPGKGTYEANGHIFSSLVGEVLMREAGGETVVEVSQQGSRSSVAAAVPEKGNIVLCRVTKINPRHAATEILLVGDRTLHEPFSGIIRAQDARSTDVDSVQIEKCFRPLDIVRAQVISLGDRKSFFLSTADDHLGVVSAMSRGGERMTGVDEKTMKVEGGEETEARKVAIGSPPSS